MKEQRMNSVIITSGNNKPLGILTSKDVLMRVVAQGLPPATTNVDKVCFCCKIYELGVHVVVNLSLLKVWPEVSGIGCRL
jgi:hypothetical protein